MIKENKKENKAANKPAVLTVEHCQKLYDYYSVFRTNQKNDAVKRIVTDLKVTKYGAFSLITEAVMRLSVLSKSSVSVDLSKYETLAKQLFSDFSQSFGKTERSKRTVVGRIVKFIGLNSDSRFINSVMTADDKSSLNGNILTVSCETAKKVIAKVNDTDKHLTCSRFQALTDIDILAIVNQSLVTPVTLSVIKPIAVKTVKTAKIKKSVKKSA